MATDNSESSVQLKSLIISPGLDVWLWQANTLQEPVVVYLNSEGADALRPLALTELPTDPANPASTSSVWATIPIHHVSLLICWLTTCADRFQH